MRSGEGLNVTIRAPALGVTVEAPGLGIGTGTPVARERVYERDYERLDNLPAINGVTIIGDKTPEEYGIVNDRHYVHDQAQVALIWNVAHNLGKYPSVTVVDPAGTQLVGEVRYIDENNVTIIFSAETAGMAYLN